MDLGSMTFCIKQSAMMRLTYEFSCSNWKFENLYFPDLGVNLTTLLLIGLIVLR